MNADRALGTCRLVRLLGRGGMGEVYEAESADGRSLAVKVFAVREGNRDFLLKRFVAEGRILSRLAHPNLVRVYDTDVDSETGAPYLAMELVLDAQKRSRTLEDVRRNGEVDEARAELWYRQLCEALHYCHAQGVVHRDVKLNNVLVDGAGNAILSDFGIARVIDPAAREELQVTTTFVEGETTGTRPVMGTYWYLAPEIRRGEPALPASDWYALGVLFFRLLTGMWYEPGTDAMDLLSPYDARWRVRLAALLAEDPSRRCPTSLPSRRGGPRVVLKRLTVLGMGVPVLLAVLLLQRGRSSQAEFANGPEDAPVPAPLSLAFSGDIRFDFCGCPPGTNADAQVSVVVTRPYWLEATPVTRRQWFAVRGEPLAAWRGGEDAPMTYVSRSEADDFCSRLNARFASRLPDGCEIRLPSVAEWRLAYARGRTMTNQTFRTSRAGRQSAANLGWYGQGVDGNPGSANMRQYYLRQNLPEPLVKSVWPDFPPQVLRPDADAWVRYSSRIAPVPVGLKPANTLGLRDMSGNCFERTYDTTDAASFRRLATEWGCRARGLYGGLGLAVTNPVSRTGKEPLMLGGYLTPEMCGDETWYAPFERMPHLGLRLCVGPKLERRDVP